MRTVLARLAVAGGAVLLATALGSCAPEELSSGPSSTPGPATDSPSLRVATSNDPEPSGRQALLAGTLKVDEDGCVRAETAESSVALVWPRGYTVRGDATDFEVLNVDATVVAQSGTPFTMAGGFTDPVDENWIERDCAPGAAWVVGHLATQ